VKINEIITEASKFGTPIKNVAKSIATSLMPQAFRQAAKQRAWRQGGKADWDAQRAEYYDLMRRKEPEIDPTDMMSQMSRQPQQHQSLQSQQDPEVEALEREIINTLPNKRTQFRFTHPQDLDVDVIIRPEGYFFTKLPKGQGLEGRVHKDRSLGLFPVKRPQNVRQINAWYDDAADKRMVREEPIDAL
jgi:hypothetical protein